MNKHNNKNGLYSDTLQFQIMLPLTAQKSSYYTTQCHLIPAHPLTVLATLYIASTHVPETIWSQPIH